GWSAPYGGGTGFIGIVLDQIAVPRKLSRQTKAAFVLLSATIPTTYTPDGPTAGVLPMYTLVLVQIQTTFVLLQVMLNPALAEMSPHVLETITVYIPTL